MKRYDEKMLHKLLDRYENSLLYSGKNQVNIRISIPVQKSILPEYFDETSTQFDVIHEQLEDLEEKGYIRLIWKNKKKGHILEKCELVVEHADCAYAYLHRKPRLAKEQDIIRICEEYCGKTAELDCFLEWIKDRLLVGESIRKYANEDEPKELAKLCELVLQILLNEKECFLRQFSVQHFHDSKIAEKDIEKAVGIIAAFSQNGALDGLDTAEILEEYNIYRNPSWLMLKGCGKFQMESDDGKKSDIDLGSVLGGIGIANQDIDRIRWSREKQPDWILTIENLTSFHQWNPDFTTGRAVLCIYLGGYHNHAKRLFLKNLHTAYPNAQYYHFGDIDCGGFRIWKDLCLKTGIPFRTYLMDLNTYCRHADSGRELTQQDRKNLLLMMEDPFFEQQKELFSLMLERGKKLEQESVFG
ncbi:MAG: DUF2399 domain-containing protein [Lachnospiraceae bacterium]|nr:DUF2399 domain-containing protein [Lachnospiraceae bacterium]